MSEQQLRELEILRIQYQQLAAESFAISRDKDRQGHIWADAGWKLETTIENIKEMEGKKPGVKPTNNKVPGD